MAAAKKKGSKPAKKAPPPKAKKAPPKKPALPAKKVVAPAKAAPPPKPAPAKAPPAKPAPAKALPAKPAAAKAAPAKPAPAPAPGPAPAKAAPPSQKGAPAKSTPGKPAVAPAKGTPAAPSPSALDAKPARKVAPSLAPAVAPVLKPLTSAAPSKTVQAPIPPPPKQGAMDQQLVSAIHYGLFAAINKTFGSFGQSVLKNASLRMLEYGYKRQWLPPKSKDPIKALNEFFQRLETMGYAERMHVSKKDDAFVCEVVNLADWDAVADLRELHYPLLPIFMNELILAFLDQYFKLIVAMEPVELVPEKRGLRIRFTTHERNETAQVHVSERPILVDFED